MIIFGDNPYFWVVMQAYSCILDTMQYRGKWACYDTFVVFSRHMVEWLFYTKN